MSGLFNDPGEWIDFRALPHTSDPYVVL
jgi:hypothetical protein